MRANKRPGSTENVPDSSCAKKPGPPSERFRESESQGIHKDHVLHLSIHLMCERPTIGKETTSLVVVKIL